MAQSNNKRNYNSWNNTETEKFIEGVKKYSRDFKEIATLVGTKEEKQIRYYYYRLLKRISKHLIPDDVVNTQNNEEVLFIFCTFRELELSATPAEQIKGNLLSQLKAFRAGKSPVPVSTPKIEVAVVSNNQADNQKISVLLQPKDDLNRKKIFSIGCKPRLSLTVSKSKKIKSIIKHLNTKWSNTLGKDETFQLMLGDLVLTLSDEKIVSDILSTSDNHITFHYQITELKPSVGDGQSPASDSDDSFSSPHQIIPCKEEKADIILDSIPEELHFLKSKLQQISEKRTTSTTTTTTTTITASVSLDDSLSFSSSPTKHSSMGYGFEDTNDKYEPYKENQKYAKLSKQFWFNHEDAVDFSCGPPPLKKAKY